MDMSKIVYPLIIVAVIGCAVLGGIWTYVSVGFLQVMGSAIREAQKDPKNK